MTVVVVGSVNQDVVARVGRIPAPGETVLATGLTRSGGGKGANQAVAARRAGGAQVAFVGAVGEDADGVALSSALAGDGIDVTGLVTVDAPTGTALISVDASGENAIVVVPGANAALPRLTAPQRDIVAGAQALVTQLEIPLTLVRDAAESRPAGAWHVLNAAPSTPLADAADDILPRVDVLVVNEHEALDVAGAATLDAAVDALAARVPGLVVTLGSRGARVACAGARRHVDAFAVTPVDTTGAGDTFCGVFAASLAASGRPPSEMDADLLAQSARRGAAAAALAVTRPGAQDAVPSLADLDAFLAVHATQAHASQERATRKDPMPKDTAPKDAAPKDAAQKEQPA
jgi:ribokinase